MIADLPGDAPVVAGAAFAASAVLALLVRRYALAHALVDVPNARSSHSVPTPRGGGAAIAIVVLVGLAVFALSGRVAPEVAVALGGGGVLVAGIGWLDDRGGVAAPPRLAVHVVAAAWTVWWLGGMPTLIVGSSSARFGGAGVLLAMLGIVWLTNLYNFMDGIDGLAAGEAIAVALAGALLVAPRSPSLASIAVLLAAAAGGFLLWNRPPARLFMGDVGSGFLGYLFGGLALASERTGAMPALLWLVLLAPFFMDATITLLRRMARGDRWSLAHRTHAYQRAVLAGATHGSVTLAVIGLTAVAAVAAAAALRSPGLVGPVVAGAAGVMGGVYLVVERRQPLPPRD